MIAKQYSVKLPSDYDMNVIRHRVADKGAAYDTFPGLHFKAFLIREHGRYGAVGNEYAPFYVWPDTEALWGFVAGAGFKGIIDSFGWTPIRTWLTLAVTAKSGFERAAVCAATREEVAVRPGTDLASFRSGEIADNEAALANDPFLAARVVGVDMDAWRLVRFALWACPQDKLVLEPQVDSFEVLRLSAPGL